MVVILTEVPLLGSWGRRTEALFHGIFACFLSIELFIFDAKKGPKFKRLVHVFHFKSEYDEIRYLTAHIFVQQYTAEIRKFVTSR